LEEKRINKEMANIRKKFKGEVEHLCYWRFDQCEHAPYLDGNLDGYQKKKLVTSLLSYVLFTIPFHRYVAKIIFTYILGYKVDIGHMEAVNLISSSKYSEKQIVRIAVGFKCA